MAFIAAGNTVNPPLVAAINAGAAAIIGLLANASVTGSALGKL